MRSRLGALVALSILGGLFLFAGAFPALADTSCGPTVESDFAGGGQVPSDGVSNGVRSGIQLRRDGSLCAAPNSGQENGFTASWLGIQSTGSTTELVQIGYIHNYISAGSSEFCHFTDELVGTASNFHSYGCSDSDGQVVYYRILVKYDASRSAYYYYLSDGCGSGYSTCTDENSGTAEFTDSHTSGEFESESDYGQSACVVNLMGNSSNHLNFGTTTNPQQELGSDGTWSSHTFTATSNPSCSDYKYSRSSSTLATWDDRNSG
jgi:hypothetical protein